jgi:hypothetical protein
VDPFNKYLAQALELEQHIADDGQKDYANADSSLGMSALAVGFRVLVMAHPVTALIAAGVGAAVAVGATSATSSNIRLLEETYVEVYSFDQASRETATKLLLALDPGRVHTLDVNALGGLLHLAKDILRPPIEDRSKKLEQVMRAAPDDQPVQKRLDIYRSALSELDAVQASLVHEFGIKKEIYLRDKRSYQEDLATKFNVFEEKLSVRRSDVARILAKRDRDLQLLNSKLDAGLLGRAEREDQAILVSRRATEATVPILAEITALEKDQNLLKNMKFDRWRSLWQQYLAIVPQANIAVIAGTPTIEQGFGQNEQLDESPGKSGLSLTAYACIAIVIFLAILIFS